jgi:hypothetical protein
MAVSHYKGPYPSDVGVVPARQVLEFLVVPEIILRLIMANHTGITVREALDIMRDEEATNYGAVWFEEDDSSDDDMERFNIQNGDQNL